MKSRKNKNRKGGTPIPSTSYRADPPIPNQRGLSIIITNNNPSSKDSIPWKKDREGNDGKENTPIPSASTRTDSPIPKGKSVNLDSNNIPSPKVPGRASEYQQEPIKTDRAGKEGDPLVQVDTQETNNLGRPIVASVY